MKTQNGRNYAIRKAKKLSDDLAFLYCSYCFSQILSELIERSVSALLLIY
jgi:hypothetical protein